MRALPVLRPSPPSVAVAAMLVLASCTTPQPGASGAPRALTRYQDAASFLMPGYQSYAFYPLPGDGEEGESAIIARCGSDFEAPHSAGYGPYRGIEVHDFGAAGLGDVEGVGEPCTISGYPAWRVDAIGSIDGDERTDLWIAHVDDRFAVASYRRELLEKSLRRHGRIELLLEPFAGLPELPSDSVAAIYLLPRQGDRTYWGRPVPTEMMGIALDPRGCLRMWHREALPEQFVSLAGITPTRPAAQLGDGWLLTTIELADQDTMRWLVLELLCGMAIFI